MKKKEYSVDIDGKTLVAEFTDLADQANGSVILRMGDTAIIATAVMSANEREGMGYFPLSVEFEEKFYSAGAILGSQYMRREGRPTDEAVSIDGDLAAEAAVWGHVTRCQLRNLDPPLRPLSPAKHMDSARPRSGEVFARRPDDHPPAVDAE